MRIKFSPQRKDNIINYQIAGEIITATIDEISDTFDFSAMPNGQAVVSEIQTLLPILPIISAVKVDGVLSVELLNYIGPNATETERFPEWQEVV